MKKKILSLLLSLAISMQCLCFTVNAETDTDSSVNIRTINIENLDEDAPAIELFEGEQIQLEFSDMFERTDKYHVSFSSPNFKAAVSQDLKLVGCNVGEERVTIYFGYEFMRFKVNVKPNENISAENRAELERINTLGENKGNNYIRRKMELLGVIDENAPRLDMDKAEEIINTYDSFDEIIKQCEIYNSYIDLAPDGGGCTHRYYWFDEKGNELLNFIIEEQAIYYTKIADNGTVIGVQMLYPNKEEFYKYDHSEYKDYDYIEYNQIKPEGYGTLNLKFIDESTGEAFTETNGKFQLVLNNDEAGDEVIKSWDASEGSEITIGDLSQEYTYELRYIDDYHGDFPYDQQYKYEIDHDKGTSRFSFGYDSELSYKVYLKKRHRCDPYLLGDVNSDNMFNIADMVTLQKWMLGKSDTVLMNWKAADLCKDNVLNVFDLCLMKKALIENS